MDLLEARLMKRVYDLSLALIYGVERSERDACLVGEVFHLRLRNALARECGPRRFDDKALIRALSSVSRLFLGGELAGRTEL